MPKTYIKLCWFALGVQMAFTIDMVVEVTATTEMARSLAKTISSILEPEGVAARSSGERTLYVPLSPKADGEACLQRIHVAGGHFRTPQSAYTAINMLMGRIANIGHNGNSPAMAGGGVYDEQAMYVAEMIE